MAGSQAEAAASRAVASGQQDVLNNARQAALGDMRAMLLFGGNAERAFGEKLNPAQIRSSAAEVLAHNPALTRDDYHTLESVVLQSDRPLQEHPKASLALARAVVFDEGGVKQDLRKAVQAETFPIEARRTAASFLGAAAGNYTNDDVRALEGGALSDDQKLRKNSVQSLILGSGPQRQNARGIGPEIDQALERIHTDDRKRPNGGDKQLRAEIERARLQTFDASQGADRSRLAESLSRPGNQDGTRLHVFEQTAKNLSKDDSANKALLLSRQFSDPEIRNQILTKYAPGQFLAENDRMAAELSRVKDKEKRQQMGRLVAESPKETLSSQAFQQVKEHAKLEGDLETRKAVLAKMPEGPISQDDLSRASEAVKVKYAEALNGDGELGQLGKLYQAKQLIQGEMKGKVHKDALETINLEIEAFQKKDSVQKELQGVAAVARQAALNGRNIGNEQAQYLTSDKFMERLDVAGKELAPDLLKTEMARLKDVAPEKLKDTSGELSRRLVERQADKNWRQMDDASRQEVVRKALLTVRDQKIAEQGPDSKDALELTKLAESNKLVKGISDQMIEVNEQIAKNGVSEIGISRVLKRGEKIQAAIDKGDTALADQLSEKFGNRATYEVNEKFRKTMAPLQSKGLMGSFGAALAAHSLINGDGFSSLPAAADTLSTTTDVLGSSNDALKVAGWLAGKSKLGSGLTHAGEALGKRVLFEALGPIGDTFDAINTGAAFVDQVGSGDTGAAVVSGTVTAGYVGAAGLGVWGICAGVLSGPVGWTALGLGVGATLLNSFAGESDEEALLRRGLTGANGKPLRLMD